MVVVVVAGGVDRGCSLPGYTASAEVACTERQCILRWPGFRKRTPHTTQGMFILALSSSALTFVLRVLDGGFEVWFVEDEDGRERDGAADEYSLLTGSTVSQNRLPLDLPLLLLGRFGWCFALPACSSRVSAVVSMGRLPSEDEGCGRRPPERKDSNDAQAAGMEGSTISEGGSGAARCEEEPLVLVVCGIVGVTRSVNEALVEAVDGEEEVGTCGEGVLKVRCCCNELAKR